MKAFALIILLSIVCRAEDHQPLINCFKELNSIIDQSSSSPNLGAARIDWPGTNGFVIYAKDQAYFYKAEAKTGHFSFVLDGQTYQLNSSGKLPHLKIDFKKTSDSLTPMMVAKASPEAIASDKLLYQIRQSFDAMAMTNDDVYAKDEIAARDFTSVQLATLKSCARVSTLKARSDYTSLEINRRVKARGQEAVTAPGVVKR